VGISGKLIRASLLAAVIAFVTTGPSSLAEGPARSTGPTISSRSAILMDASTGVILFDKDGSVRAAPASITKILTAAIVIENLVPGEIVSISKAACSVPGSSVYLVENERVSTRDLLYGLILNSGNDAAIALAERVSGSVEEFCHLMNEKAAQIGALESNFENPHGLDSDNHYTTARDMALITKSALGMPLFREIAGATTYPWEGQCWSTTLINHNKMLWQYEGCTGVKTGFTSAAKHTLVASAMKDGRELIAVLMGGESAAILRLEAQSLLDYGFDRCLVDLNAAGDRVDTAALPFGKEMALETAESFSAYLPEGSANEVRRTVELSEECSTGRGVTRGQIVGRLVYWLKGTSLGSVDVVSGTGITYSTLQRLNLAARTPRAQLLLLSSALITVAGVAVHRARRKRTHRRLRLSHRRQRYLRQRGRREGWRNRY